MTYLALQVGLWSQFGVFAQQLAADFLGIDLPVWFWILVFLVITTALTMVGVNVNLRILGVLLILEIVAVAALIIGVFANSAGKDLSLVSFAPSGLVQPGLGVAILFVFACFTTFEATTVFSEEAREPRRTIPRALFAVIVFVGVFYTLATWAVSVAVGPDNIQEAAANDLAGIIFAVARDFVGPWLDVLMQILVVSSFIAMLIGVQNMFARYMYALARARVLPQPLAHVTKRSQAPARAALINGVIVTVIIMVFLWSGADPITVVFAWFVALGTIGFVVMMAFASVAIVVFFIVEKLERGFWTTRVAPFAAVFLMVDVVLVISNPQLQRVALQRRRHREAPALVHPHRVRPRRSSPGVQEGHRLRDGHNGRRLTPRTPPHHQKGLTMSNSTNAVGVTEQDYIPVENWPDVTAMLEGFGEPALPATEDLEGAAFDIVFDNGWTIAHRFDDATVTWTIVDGDGTGMTGTHPYRAVEARTGLYFVDFIKGEGAHASDVSMVIDRNDGRVTVADSSFVDRDGAVRMQTDDSHRPHRPAPAGSSRSDGRMSSWASGSTTATARPKRYEHLYLNGGTFVWHCVRGAEQGLADVDPATVYELGDGIVMLHWSETVKPVESFVLIDLVNERSIGRMFCWDGPTLAPVHLPFDSRFTVLNETTHPAE